MVFHKMNRISVGVDLSAIRSLHDIPLKKFISIIGQSVVIHP